VLLCLALLCGRPNRPHCSLARLRRLPPCAGWPLTWKTGKVGEFKSCQGKVGENRKSRGKCVLACMKFGQLVLRKIIEIVTTRCQILRLQCTISILAGAPSQTLLRELTALPQTP